MIRAEWERLRRLAETFTFRLAMVYVALFSVSVILLFAFIYTFSTRYVNEDIENAISLRYALLKDQYDENGSPAVEARIAELIASDDESSEIYLLVNQKGEKLAGNLNEWPEHAKEEGKFEKNGQWVRFLIESSRENPKTIEVKAATVPLSKWRNLLIGQSMQSKDRVQQTVIRTFWASLLLTLAMAFAGALVVTRSVIARLSVINRSAERIIEGNMTERIPHAQSGDEFDELSQRLNTMLDRMVALMNSLSQFANNIAHDLRSPLNRIIARTEAGLRGIKETSAARRLLEANVEDMEGLIATFNSILRISELESNAAFRDFAPCDLSALLTKLAELYEPVAHEKEIQFVTQIEPGLELRAEKNLLTQAIANLLDNSLKFTPPGGQISLLGTRAEEGFIVTIADSGPGIPAEYRDKVFEKFFRIESSRHTKGNGLGLSLVAAIMHIHGAQITLHDNQPGLRVILRFPKV